MSEKNLILDQRQILQKIKRIAIEIYERNFKEEEIVLAGIYDKGYVFAQLLEKELKEVSRLKVTLVKVSLDKFTPTQTEVTIDADPSQLINKSIILTDDVLNTGRTLAYSLKPFLNMEIKKIQTAVVVDRSHNLFPIVADYVGYSLATTIKEHIEVSFEEGNFGVYLH
ncbi:MAG TPA: phosphoribosyltransferase family protein [Cytophagaceae bacterium]